MTETTNNDLPISADLLEILRDPVAVQDKETYGDDPGRLELVHNCWLVSQDTGYKYPIKDGIPVMLIEEGEKWKDTAIADLPVPPPPLIEDAPEPSAPTPEQTTLETAEVDAAHNVILIIAALAVLLIIWRLTRPKSS